MRKVAKAGYNTCLFMTILLLFCNPCLLEAQAIGKGNLTGFVFAEDGSTAIEGAVVRLKSIIEEATYESRRTDAAGAFTIDDIEEGIYWAGISTPAGDFDFEDFVGIRKDETAKISFALNPYEFQSISPPEEMKTSNPVQPTPPSAEEDSFLTEGGPSEEMPLEGIFVGKVADYDIAAMEASFIIEEGIIRVGDTIHFRGANTNFSQEVKLIRVESDYVKKVSAGQIPAVRVIDRVAVGDMVYLTAKKKSRLFRSPVGVATVLATSTGVVYGIVKLKEEEPEVSPFKK